MQPSSINPVENALVSPIENLEDMHNSNFVADWFKENEGQDKTASTVKSGSKLTENNIDLLSEMGFKTF